MPVSVVALGTSFLEVADQALCAERLSANVRVMYFMEGPDTLRAIIFLDSMSQVHIQCERIDRQLAAEGLKLKHVEARLIVSAFGESIPLMRGEKVSLPRRCWAALKDRFVEGFVPAVVTIAMTSALMTDEPALLAAQIGLVAASATALTDALVTGARAGRWIWKVGGYE